MTDHVLISIGFSHISCNSVYSNRNSRTYSKCKTRHLIHHIHCPVQSKVTCLSSTNLSLAISRKAGGKHILYKKKPKENNRILHLKDTAQVGVTSIKCSVRKISSKVQEVKEDKSLSLYVSSSETGLKN